MKLPRPPGDKQMIALINPRKGIYSTAGIFAVVSSLGWLLYMHHDRQVMLGFIAFMFLTMLPFMTNVFGALFVRPFDMKAHDRLRQETAAREQKLAVDVLIPVCGEEIEVIRNTLHHAQQLRQANEGGRYQVRVILCDDTRDPQHSALIQEATLQHGVTYVRRPDPGVGKKSGNLNYALRSGATTAPFFTIFDADFCPRTDWLQHLMPYIEQDPRVSIVQTPQHFTTEGINNIQRAAAYNQELYYRIVQRLRERLGLAGCSGSCAVYRRQAINDIGGFPLVECSEDINTGLLTLSAGYRIRYIPLILSQGLSPARLQTFFTQQYRWALGGIELMFTRRLWSLHGLGRKRWLFVFLNSFYVFNVIGALAFPAAVVTGLTLAQGAVNPASWLALVFLCLFSYVLVPFWNTHRAGLFVLPLSFMYSFIHVQVFLDFLIGRKMEWIPSNAQVRRNARFERYLAFLFFYPFLYLSLVIAILANYPQNFGRMYPALLQCLFIFSACLSAFGLDGRFRENLMTLREAIRLRFRLGKNQVS
jgi:cellulose synthase (UDP-forming)